MSAGSGRGRCRLVPGVALLLAALAAGGCASARRAGSAGDGTMVRTDPAGADMRSGGPPGAPTLPAATPPSAAAGAAPGAATDATPGTALAAPDRRTLDSLAAHALAYAERQLRRSATSIDSGYPRSTAPDGHWVLKSARDWTSGFYPGMLWMMYERTRDPFWRERAEHWTAGIEPIKTLTTSHDVGFMLFSSFGRGYRLTGDAHYRDVLLQGAASLATRFDPVVGATKSWELRRATDRRKDWRFNVIIDNMMNLELLFWAGANGGDPALRTMAERHALTSVRAHLRPDGSTAHVALFDPATGAFEGGVTWQGYADTSAWARGQAWAVYGFTMAYQETHRAELLDGARRAADFFLAHLPADAVPYWDFRHPGIPDVPRDASAAAIAAAGLFRLADATTGADAARYRAGAHRILASLCRDYLSEGTSAASILLHGVGDGPRNGEVDVGLVYADYYFLEALLRYEHAGRR